MNQEVQTLEAILKEIENNSTLDGKYTDGQTQRLAQLAVSLPSAIRSSLRSLERECDRLRDGPHSMVEGNYIYYQNDECLNHEHVGVGGPDTVVIRVKDYDGEGKLKLTQFNGNTFRMTSRLLRNGSQYVILEIISENVVENVQGILDTCPDHETIKQMILDGDPKRLISS